MSDQPSTFDEETRRLLVHAGERAQRTPGMLGHALRRFAELEQLPDVAVVAAHLRGGFMAADELARLCLCRRPPDATLAADAARIAAPFRLDEALLVKALRRVQVAEAMGGRASLMAARRDEEEDRDDA